VGFLVFTNGDWDDASKGKFSQAMLSIEMKLLDVFNPKGGDSSSEGVALGPAAGPAHHPSRRGHHSRSRARLACEGDAPSAFR
jgi:hypothetical protein